MKRMRTRYPRLLLASFLVALLALTGAACGGEKTTNGGNSATLTTRDDLQSIFTSAGVKGTFAVLDTKSGRTTVVDRKRAERAAVPASTFKIPHALIALETGVVRDENEVIPYGGKPQPIRAWERDMTMREAIKLSAVPIFQELARRIGPEREREWLSRLGYGNREVGSDVEQFWLQGPLEISPMEQTKFLAKLAARSLPASKKNQDTVADMVNLERTPDHALYGKTGWRFDSTPQLGWWVGWVERGGRTYTFALNIDMAGDADAAKRIPLGREFLARLGVLSQ